MCCSDHQLTSKLKRHLDVRESRLSGALSCQTTPTDFVVRFLSNKLHGVLKQKYQLSKASSYPKT